MSAPSAINEWLTINSRVYNAFALKHIIFSLEEDGWLARWDASQYLFWLDNFIHNGPMPGCTRFAVPGDDDDTYLFLEGLQWCWDFYWHDRDIRGPDEEDDGEEIEEDDMMDDLPYDEAANILAVARWVRDIFQEDIVDFDVDELPVAEVLEIVDFSRD